MNIAWDCDLIEMIVHDMFFVYEYRYLSIYAGDAFLKRVRSMKMM